MFEPMPPALFQPFGAPPPPVRTRRVWVIVPIAAAVAVSGVVTTALLVRGAAVEEQVLTQLTETGNAVESVIAEIPVPTIDTLQIPQIEQIPLPTAGLEVALPTTVAGLGLDALPSVEVPAVVPPVGAPPAENQPADEPAVMPAPVEQPAAEQQPNAEHQPAVEHQPAPDHHEPQPEHHEPPAVTFHHFSSSTTSVHCSDDTESHPVTVSWSSSNADQAWFGVDTADAQAAPLQAVPTSGSFTWDFFCSNESTVFTVSVAGDAGTVHRSVTVTRT